MSEMQRAWYTKILSKDAHSLNALGGPDRVKLLNVLMQVRRRTSPHAAAHAPGNKKSGQQQRAAAAAGLLARLTTS